MKVIINSRYGGFGLSELAKKELCRRKGVEKIQMYEILRNDSDLVNVVEIMGNAANGPYSNLKVVEIPDGIEWIIQEDKGEEWIAEKHRTWD